MAESVKLFLEQIESANPNSGEFDEDDLGISWGHQQFRGWQAKLNSWEAIGSPGNARRLIAAIIKTSCVACQLCHELEMQNRSMSTPTLYLSDSYLWEIAEHLWDLWKGAGGVGMRHSIFDFHYWSTTLQALSKGKTVDQPPSITAPAALLPPESDAIAPKELVAIAHIWNADKLMVTSSIALDNLTKTS